MIFKFLMVKKKIFKTDISFKFLMLKRKKFLKQTFLTVTDNKFRPVCKKKQEWFRMTFLFLYYNGLFTSKFAPISEHL